MVIATRLAVWRISSNIFFFDQLSVTRIGDAKILVDEEKLTQIISSNIVDDYQNVEEIELNEELLEIECSPTNIAMDYNIPSVYTDDELTVNKKTDSDVNIV